MSRLLQFAKDTKETNPNLLNDVLNGYIKPSKMLDNAMKRFYND